MSNKIREILQTRKTEGDVGIEIEVEAEHNLPYEELPKPWRAEADGSLRGSSMEYITNGPVPVGNVAKHVADIQASAAASQPIHSFRAAVHIHVNVQELTIEQVANVAAVYYCLETALMRYCGEDREGNHFCLRLKDAKYPLDRIIAMLNNNDIWHLDTDNLRYSAMNLRAVTRYGSLEFRGMETTPTFSKIDEWARMLIAIRDYGASLTHRQNIAYAMSADGPENWAREILGNELFQLLDYQDFQTDVMKCMRQVQPIIYHGGMNA